MLAPPEREDFSPLRRGILCTALEPTRTLAQRGLFCCAAHTSAVGVQSRTQRQHAPHGAVQALDLLTGSIGSIFPTVGRSALSALRSEISRFPLLR